MFILLVITPVSAAAPPATGTLNLAYSNILACGTISEEFLAAFDGTDSAGNFSRQLGSPKIQKPELGELGIFRGNRAIELVGAHVEKLQAAKVGPFCRETPCLVGVTKVDDLEIGREVAQFGRKSPGHEIAFQKLERCEVLEQAKLGGDTPHELRVFFEAKVFQVGPATDFGGNCPTKSICVPQSQKLERWEGDIGECSLQISVGKIWGFSCNSSCSKFWRVAMEEGIVPYN